jgi:hypothetical protein
MNIARFHDAAKDAVARYLARRLIVPRVFFEAAWPDEARRVDVLAIDRAGKGDVHVVEVKEEAESLANVMAVLPNAPAHFVWIAIPSTSDVCQELSSLPSDMVLRPQEGMGRIGVMEVFSVSPNSLGVRVPISPERFRGPTSKDVDAFTAEHEADVKVV